MLSLYLPETVSPFLSEPRTFICFQRRLDMSGILLRSFMDLPFSFAPLKKRVFKGFSPVQHFSVVL